MNYEQGYELGSFPAAGRAQSWASRWREALLSLIEFESFSSVELFRKGSPESLWQKVLQNTSVNEAKKMMQDAVLAAKKAKGKVKNCIIFA